MVRRWQGDGKEMARGCVVYESEQASQFFDSCSILLRYFFDSCSIVLRNFTENYRTTHGELTENSRACVLSDTAHIRCKGLGTPVLPSTRAMLRISLAFAISICSCFSKSMISFRKRAFAALLNVDVFLIKTVRQQPSLRRECRRTGMPFFLSTA